MERTNDWINVVNKSRHLPVSLNTQVCMRVHTHMFQICNYSDKMRRLSKLYLKMFILVKKIVQMLTFLANLGNYWKTVPKPKPHNVRTKQVCGIMFTGL